jgi:hypothetical protein
VRLRGESCLEPGQAQAGDEILHGRLGKSTHRENDEPDRSSQGQAACEEQRAAEESHASSPMA